MNRKILGALTRLTCLSATMAAWSPADAARVLFTYTAQENGVTTRLYAIAAAAPKVYADLPTLSCVLADSVCSSSGVGIFQGGINVTARGSNTSRFDYLSIPTLQTGTYFQPYATNVVVDVGVLADTDVVYIYSAPEANAATRSFYVVTDGFQKGDFTPSGCIYSDESCARSVLSVTDRAVQTMVMGSIDDEGLDRLVKFDDFSVDRGQTGQFYGYDAPNASLRIIGPVAPAVAAVPEPATWAMMIAGFGVVGGALRRRGRPAEAKLAIPR